MKEYIDREAAVAYLENHKKVGKAEGFILSANEDAIIKFLKEKCPAADVVEVVRCKDCIHRRVPTRCSLWMGTSGDNDYFREHGDDFYCAFGERTPQEEG